MKPQEKILQFIREFLEEHQMPPTLREIQDHMGFAAIGTVQYHIKSLADAGLIDVKARLSRGIMLTQRAIGIPIIGRVPAGPAQLAFEQVEGYLSSVHGEEKPVPVSEPSPAAAQNYDMNPASFYETISSSPLALQPVALSSLLVEQAWLSVLLAARAALGRRPEPRLQGSKTEVPY